METGLKIGNFEIKGAPTELLCCASDGWTKEPRRSMSTICENPNDEIVLDALGVIALSRRDYDKAVEYLQRAVKIVPDFGSARNNLGRTYLEMGKPQEALPHLAAGSSAVSERSDSPDESRKRLRCAGTVVRSSYVPGAGSRAIAELSTSR